MTLPDLQVLYRCADKSNDGLLDFYELLDLIMTVPAEKVKPDATRLPESCEQHPVASCWDDEQKKMYEDALRKCEKDQEEFVSMVSDLCQTLEQVRDDDKRH